MGEMSVANYTEGVLNMFKMDIDVATISYTKREGNIPTSISRVVVQGRSYGPASGSSNFVDKGIYTAILQKDDTVVAFKSNQEGYGTVLFQVQNQNDQ